MEDFKNQTQQKNPSHNEGLFYEHLSAEQKLDVFKHLLVQVETNISERDWDFVCKLFGLCEHKRAISRLKNGLLEGLHAKSFSKLKGGFLPLEVVEKLLKLAVDIFEKQGILEKGNVSLVRLSFDGASDIFKTVSHSKNFEIMSIQIITPKMKKIHSVKTGFSYWNRTNQ